MPIYEFVCEVCSQVKELMQKYKDDPPKCDECNLSMKRQMSAGNTVFDFKGTGFYTTDYKGKK